MNNDNNSLINIMIMRSVRSQQKSNQPPTQFAYPSVVSQRFNLIKKNKNIYKYWCMYKSFYIYILWTILYTKPRKSLNYPCERKSEKKSITIYTIHSHNTLYQPNMFWNNGYNQPPTKHIHTKQFLELLWTSSILYTPKNTLTHVAKRAAPTKLFWAATQLALHFRSRAANILFCVCLVSVCTNTHVGLCYFCVQLFSRRRRRDAPW